MINQLNPKSHKHKKFFCESSPRAANCCLLPDPGGRPLPRFCTGDANDDAGADDAGGAEFAVGDMVEMVPSGPYFLGRPLFLFIGSPDVGIPAETVTFAAPDEGDSTGNVDPAELAP